MAVIVTLVCDSVVKYLLVYLCVNQFVFVLYYDACLSPPLPPSPRPVNILIIQTTAERETGKFQNETKVILLFFFLL